MKTFLKQCGIVVLATIVAISGFTTLQIQNRGGVNAAEKPDCNVVYFGDSTSSGFGCIGFSNENNSINDSVPIKNSYPKKITALLQKTGFYNSVNPIYYNWNGMRTDELRAFLQSDYYNKITALESVSEEKYSGYIGFMKKRMKRYVNHLGNGSYETTQNVVKESIKNADMIFIDNNMSSMGEWLFERLKSQALGGIDLFKDSAGHGDIKLGDIVIDPNIKSAAEKNTKEICNKHLGVMASMLGDVVDDFIFCFASAAENLNNIVPEIKKINPDAKICVVGTSNIIGKMSFNITKGNSIRIDKVLGDYYESYNRYIQNKLPCYKEYQFIKTGKLETFADTWVAGKVKVVKKKLIGNKEYVNSFTQMLTDEETGVKVLFGAAAQDQIKMANLLLAATKHTSVSLNDIVEIMGNDNIFEAFAKKLTSYATSNKKPEKIFSNAELFILNILSLGYFADGVGIHPSYKGCQQKYDAVSQAVVKMLAQNHPYKAKKATLSVKKGKTVVAASNINFVYGDKVSSVKSSNKKIATVANKTKLKALKKGTSKITVKFRSGLSKSYTVKVK